MGSGGWFKTIINSKKLKVATSKQVKGSSTSAKSSGFKWKKQSHKDASTFTKNTAAGNNEVLGMPVEDVAATRIQSAFRAYMARKSLRRLKGIARLQAVTQKYPVRKQAKITLSYLHTWSRIQAEIRARRLCMVTEGRLKQKKLENKLKLEAKLHDLEVEWSGGFETMEEILSRIHHREEAAVKRERALAYAFSHQWRANSNPFGHSNYELGKADWGWSWKERWIAARPWESRVLSKSNTEKKEQQQKQASKLGKNVDLVTPKSSISVKSSVSSGRPTTKARRSSFPPAEKTNPNKQPNRKGTATARRLSFPAAEKKPGSQKKTLKTKEAKTATEHSVS